MMIWNIRSYIRARLLMINNFDDPFEPSTADGKLIFYDALTNHTQEVVSDIDSVSDLNTSFNNQICFYIYKYELNEKGKLIIQSKLTN